jgi:hypothetical protein
MAKEAHRARAELLPRIVQHQPAKRRGSAGGALGIGEI